MFLYTVISFCFSLSKGDSGVTAVENFATEECPYPTDLPNGKLLVKTLCLSVDPYMVRFGMNSLKVGTVLI